jgi:RNA recognition motif-containing protein
MSRIFVGNIPHACSAPDLRLWVESHGFQVEAAEVIYDRVTGKSRGFGFVSLYDLSDLKGVVGALNGQSFNGRVLTVNTATPI